MTRQSLADKAPTGTPDPFPATLGRPVLPYRVTAGVDRTLPGATVPARVMAVVTCVGLVGIGATNLHDAFSTLYLPVDLAGVAVFALCLAVACGKLGRHRPGHI